MAVEDQACLHKVGMTTRALWSRQVAQAPGTEGGELGAAL